MKGTFQTVLRRLGSWASLRTLIVAFGLPFVALSVGGACLDYAGEDWGLDGCDTAPTTGAGSSSLRFGVGSGSGSGSILIDAGTDCGAATTSSSTGAGSGSGSAAAP